MQAGETAKGHHPGREEEATAQAPTQTKHSWGPLRTQRNLYIGLFKARVWDLVESSGVTADGAQMETFHSRPMSWVTEHT